MDEVRITTDFDGTELYLAPYSKTDVIIALEKPDNGYKSVFINEDDAVAIIKFLNSFYNLKGE